MWPFLQLVWIPFLGWLWRKCSKESMWQPLCPSVVNSIGPVIFIIGLVFPYMNQYLGPNSFGLFVVVIVRAYFYALFVLRETQKVRSRKTWLRRWSGGTPKVLYMKRIQTPEPLSWCCFIARNQVRIRMFLPYNRVSCSVVRLLVNTRELVPYD
mgnify:CR=1 FL=1